MQAKRKKVPALDKLLEEGYFKSKDEALPWLMSGSVYSGTLLVKSASQPVPEDVPLTVRGYDMPYTSKGGLKLEGAIRDFAIEVKGRICIDAGASTGGFTDCLQKHGAARVYAVDVGYGQLAGSLRQNERVVNLEKTNISDPSLLTLDPRPNLASVDLSYLSLRKGIPAFSAVLHGQGEMMCLVKPLFETEDAEARRTGILPEDALAPLLRDLIRDVNAMPDTIVQNITISPVTGNHGTREFFLHVILHADHPAPELESQLLRAVSAVKTLSKYKKA